MTFIAMSAIIYLLISLMLLFGCCRRKPTVTRADPPVSVIVAARNEEKNISACLRSLSQLNYPHEKLEIIIVNDRSTDNTGEIIDDFVKQFDRFIAIHISESRPNLSGKAGALAQAIDTCRGEFIFITDADCIVPPNWIGKMIPYFGADVGVVAGFTLIKPMSGTYSLFDTMQAIDLLYLLTVASGAAGLGIPLSCIGNNFAFRKSAYSEVGGYEGVGYSLTEDFALLNTICRSTNWKIRFPFLQDSLVLSQPLPSIACFSGQRKRWATGAFRVHPIGKLLIITGVLAQLLLLSGFVLYTADAALFTALSFFMIADLVVLGFALSKIRKIRWLFYYPLFKAFNLIYLVILPLLLLFKPTVRWKDIVYPVRAK